MNDLQLLGPRAYGEALGRAVLKATAEDFQVDEVLDIPLTGEGEHLWLWVEKRGLNTEEAARRIAKAAGVPLRTVSYAGLKDRQALTRQWFSVQLPGKADPDMSSAENDTLKILKTARHKRKLQRGAHSANGFTLRLTQLAGDTAAIDARLQLIAQHGIPNYFGAQRFGHNGGNVVDARESGPRAGRCRSSATCVRVCSPRRAASCSTKCWRRVWPMDLGSVPRSAICSPLPTAAVFSRRGRPNAATHAWRSWTCTRPGHSGVRAIRRPVVQPLSLNRPLPPVKPTCAIGW